MTTFKNISGSLPRHFTLGNTRNRQIVQHKRQPGNKPFSCQLPLIGIVALVALASPIRAAVFPVPGVFTLQGAVDAARAVPGIHEIHLTASPVFTDARVHIGPVNPAWIWALVIRPAPGRARATIASLNGSQTIFSIGPNGARDVYFVDLDIIRHSTNNRNLIEISSGRRITFERCRIGSDWASVGSQGWTMLAITHPTDILVRNSIFFSYMPGNFDRGIKVTYDDNTNSLRLYNNVVADYRRVGIDITSNAADSLVLLRNNVVSNRPGLAPEPIAYRSNVAAAVNVVSSHNVAFAGVGNSELVAGAQPISGFPAAFFLSRAVGQVGGAVVDHIWNTIPPWDPNPDFWRLQRFGSLHSPRDTTQGITVLNGVPHPQDIAVTTDIELNIRPSGVPKHTDRGVDQVEK